MVLTLVTGNKNKLAEWKRLLPTKYEIKNADIDLDEIQSTDPEVIIEHKARQAYGILKRPLIVEDVSAGLDRLKGLPGPFVKQFLKVLGDDALHQLATSDKEPAKVSCIIGYYDGRHLKTFTSTIVGHIVASKGNSRFGIDKVFIPLGSSKTYAEMASNEKDTYSHRSKAISKFADFLDQNK